VLRFGLKAETLSLGILAPGCTCVWFLSLLLLRCVCNLRFSV